MSCSQPFPGSLALHSNYSPIQRTLLPVSSATTKPPLHQQHSHLKASVLFLQLLHKKRELMGWAVELTMLCCIGIVPLSLAVFENCPGQEHVHLFKRDLLVTSSFCKDAQTLSLLFSHFTDVQCGRRKKGTKAQGRRPAPVPTPTAPFCATLANGLQFQHYLAPSPVSANVLFPPLSVLS